MLNFKSNFLNCDIKNNIAFIELNRPQSLNAINLQLAKDLFDLLREIEYNDNIVAVVIEGKGRAFCAGGDIVEAYHSGKKGQPALEFFKTEYLFNIYLNSFAKPYISLLDGIVMGGGVGISIYGKYRIATKNTLFAMPEAAIGFFTDIGAAYFCQRFPLPVALYLCLTAAHLNAQDCLKLNLATHFCDNSSIDSLKDQLISVLAPYKWQNCSADKLIFTEIDNLLEDYIFSNQEPNLTLDIMRKITSCFTAQSVEQIIANLEYKAKAGCQFCASSLSSLSSFSPLSLKIIFYHLTNSRSLSLEEVMKLDYRIMYHMLHDSEFYEGVRAMLVDKDKAPIWQYKTLTEVPEIKVLEHFSAIDQELF